MSDLPGNPHFNSSFGSLMRIEGKTLTYAESENTLRGAQVTATLALAYEQRTANLIAWQALGIQQDETSEPAPEAEKDIASRLGFTS